MHVFRGMSRIGTAILLASLCLNVLLVAYIGTQWFDRWRMPIIVAAPTRLMEAIARRLPSDDADVLWRVYRTREAEVTAAQSDYRAAMTAAGELLAAEPLNMDAVREAIVKARTERIELGDLSIAVVIEALPQISPEGRKKLVSRLRRP